jgi:hypothetical protein
MTAALSTFRPSRTSPSRPQPPVEPRPSGADELARESRVHKCHSQIGLSNLQGSRLSDIIALLESHLGVLLDVSVESG